MEAPDKIYISKNETVHGRLFDDDICYIRKDLLLDYLKKEFSVVDFHLKAQDDPVWWGQRNAFQQVIDKLNSM